MSVETLTHYGPLALAALAGVLLLWPAIVKMAGSAFDWSTSGIAALFARDDAVVITPTVELRDDVADPLWRVDKLRRLAAWCREHGLDDEADSLEGTVGALLFTPEATPWPIREATSP